jgi:hypothetical protein
LFPPLGIYEINGSNGDKSLPFFINDGLILLE